MTRTALTAAAAPTPAMAAPRRHASDRAALVERLAHDDPGQPATGVATAASARRSSRCPTPPEAIIGRAGGGQQPRPDPSTSGPARRPSRPMSVTITAASPGAPTDGRARRRPLTPPPSVQPRTRTSPSRWSRPTATRPGPAGGQGSDAGRGPRRRGPDHDPGHARRRAGPASPSAPRRRPGPAPRSRRAADAGDDGPVDRIAGAGRVEVDHVDPPGAGGDEATGPRRPGRRRRRSPARSRPPPGGRSARPAGRWPGRAPRSTRPVHGGDEVGQQLPGRSRPTSRDGTGSPTADPGRPRRLTGAAVVAGGDHVVGPASARIRVHEVDPGLAARARRPAGSSGRARRSRFHCICGRFTPVGEPPDAPGQDPEPGTSGSTPRSPRRASASPRRCRGTGVPAVDRLERPPGRGRSPAAPPCSARTLPTPGSTTPPARRPDPASVDQPGVAADVLQGLLGRAQVADAVVEDGDHAAHSTALGRGHPAALDADGVAQGAGHALERGLQDVVGVAPATHAQVQGDRRRASPAPARTPRPAAGRRAASRAGRPRRRRPGRPRRPGTGAPTGPAPPR